MSGAEGSNIPTNENLKPYGITNIKAFVPLVLDLNQLNYDAWRILFTTHCKAYGLYGHLDGTSQPTDATRAEWNKLDSLVSIWIYGTLSQSLLPTVLKEGSTAHTIWTSLENLFRDNKDTRAIDLEDELRSMTLGDRSITDLCTKMTQISDLLANIGSPVAEKTLVTYLLNAISPRFDNVATLIRHSDPLPSFLKVRSMLTLEERKAHRDIPAQATHDDHSSSPTVLHAGSPAQPREQRSNRSNNHNRRQPSRDSRRQPPADQQQRRSQQPPPATTFPPWPPYGWPMSPWPYGWPSPPSNRPPRGSHSRQQPGLLGSTPQQPPHQQPPAAFHATAAPPQPNSAPWQWFPPVSQDQATDLTHAFNAMSMSEQPDHTWYMDTGATNHLASDTGSPHKTAPA